jgi:hypothetical protein
MGCREGRKDQRLGSKRGGQDGQVEMDALRLGSGVNWPVGGGGLRVESARLCNGDCRWAGGCGWWCGDGVVWRSCNCGVACHTKKLLMGPGPGPVQVYAQRPSGNLYLPHQNPVNFTYCGTLTPLTVETTKTVHGWVGLDAGRLWYMYIQSGRRGTTKRDHPGTVCRDGAGAKLQTGDDGFHHEPALSQGVTSLLQHRLPG